jgi:uncharacterized iron-regulated protein
MRRWIALLLAGVAACCACKAPAGDAARSNAPAPTLWTTTLDRDFPLVGEIWRPSSASKVDERSLFAALTRADFVLLGEQHDNPDHHRLQAEAIAALVGAGEKPTVALEMLEPDDDALVAHYRLDPRATASGLGPALAWDKRGWPAWAAYVPIAEVVFHAGLPLVSANLPRSVVRSVAHEGTGALPPEAVILLGLDHPLAPELEASLDEELRSSHCGQLPESMVASMALAQRARDGQMALRMLAGATPVVLIAGAGHARTDRGVPARLHAAKPSARVVSVAFVEVDPKRSSPDDYASRFGVTTLPFDFVWFTPRASDDDPCAGFPAIHGPASAPAMPAVPTGT